ncbi:MAG: hypothetical protein ACR2RE_23770 [Geminicoccaceae bacterium]
MTDTQAVAGQPNTNAEHSAEGDGAQEPTVDELLKQFETATEPEQPDPAKAATDLTADDVKSVVSWANEERVRRSTERVEKDIAEAVETVKGELDIDPGIVRDLMYGRASTDSRFMRAFQQRHTSPEAWMEVQKAFGRELAAKFKPGATTDPDLSDDRAALESAVRSAATRPTGDDAPPDFASMSDAEFARHQKKVIKK